MYSEAAAVFYSSNRIMVVPPDDFGSKPVDLKDGLLSASQFFTSCIPSDMLCHLRTLEIMLPKVSGHEPWEDEADSIFHDWHAAVAHLGQHANLGALTIVMLMEVCESPTEPLVEFAANVPAEKFVALLPILEPFRRLRGLSKFFVRLHWQDHWSPTGSNPMQTAERFEKEGLGSHVPFLQRLGSKFQEAESRLEQFVMGTQYDSLAVGKFACGPDVWISDMWS
ncbi:retrograde regulation protein [Purpureocillium lavendulum]|uniref:Retrograde regulation protein n=1 Tax=Purpureocillium lavendulum TaxID=1247861 RepID=A0AB34G4G0_9HYPO|nr:retrograde regulation protein [Purpureocillium lavendulum]